MRSSSVFVAAAGLLAASAAHAWDPWDVNDNYFGASVAEASWTINEDFPGTKTILDGRYLIKRETVPRRQRLNCDCAVAGERDRILGSFAGQVQWGRGDSGIEYGRMTATVLSYQTEFELRDTSFQPLRDTIEWGVFRHTQDDPLGIESYTELTFVEVARTWRYARSADSAWNFDMGVNLSAGYAWAESLNETFQEVSNPILGSWWMGKVTHRSWGEFFLEQRVINGFTLSSPARGGSISREARARAGYRYRFSNCMVVELYSEKRSFNFSDPNLQDLYTKSKRTGVQLGCSF